MVGILSFLDAANYEDLINEQAQFFEK